MAGRRPLATNIKKLRGNPGGRPLNEHEPKFSGKPVMPRIVEKTLEAKAEWERVMSELDALDLLKATDQAVLTAYCMQWARYLQAEYEISEEGQTVRQYKTNKAGDIVTINTVVDGVPVSTPVIEIKRHPATINASDALKQLRALATSFGFDPSSRSKIQLNPDDKEKDPFESFLNGDDETEDDASKPN